MIVQQHALSQCRAAIAVVLLCALGVPAPWVPLKQIDSEPSQIAPQGTQNSVSVEAANGAIPLSVHHLPLVKRSNTRSTIGNSLGAMILPQLKSARNRALVGAIHMGTPPQKVDCLLDSSGSDIWIPSKKCSTCARDGAEQRTFYNASASSTFRVRVRNTPFGSAPISVRVLYGGGSASGYVVTDTMQFGPATIKNQDFVVAEEAGPDARNSRAWDGVFGIGWQARASEEEAMPQYDKLAKLPGMQAMYSIVPTGQGTASMFVGRLPPEDVVSSSSIAWSPARPPHSPWVVSAQISFGSGSPRRIEAVLETGTSFLLAPPHTYLRFVRTVLPTFDKRCGVDRLAGNLVVCKCAARFDLPANHKITFSFPRSGDKATQEFTIPSDDLFQNIDGSDLCVLQIQQRPASTKVDDPYGLLGAPHLDGPGDLGSPDAFGMPLPKMPLPLDPFQDSIPFGPDPMESQGPFEPVKQPFPSDMLNLSKLLPDLLGAALNDTVPDLMKDLTNGGVPNIGHDGVVKEVVVQSLGDGTRCETDVLRNADGKILDENITIRGPDGQKLRKAKANAECSGTRVKGRRLQPADILNDLNDIFGEIPEMQYVPSDLWVVGDIFLRRHAVILDFGGNRVGIAVPNTLPLGSTRTPAASQAAGGVEALEGGVEALEGSGSMVQSWEAPDTSGLRAHSSKSSMRGGAADGLVERTPSGRSAAKAESSAAALADAPTKSLASTGSQSLVALVACGLVFVIAARYRRSRRATQVQSEEASGLRLPALEEDESVFE
eukprot:TRINITY_DN2785_c0_g2_i1.p1 TRINITY_DN2785_c0_g2~~TRINITY_DN2785_c0_g2_i1.p1  ORF type:complete len:775 (-),score=101.01 TRINITY_DN2785_c0_g2_i1:228-2552(-)